MRKSGLIFKKGRWIRLYMCSTETIGPESCVFTILGGWDRRRSRWLSRWASFVTFLWKKWTLCQCFLYPVSDWMQIWIYDLIKSVWYQISHYQVNLKRVAAFITCEELAMGPAIMPRLILLPLFFWLSESWTFFSEKNPSFITVLRSSWPEDNKHTLLSLLSGEAEKLGRVLLVFSEGVRERLTCDRLLVSKNLYKNKTFRS